MKKFFPLIKLTAVLVFVPVAIYAFAVSDTVNLYREYRQVKKSAGTVQVADKIEKHSASAPLLSNGEFMRMISSDCIGNKVTVGHFSPKEIGNEGPFHLVSAQLVLTGGFVGLLKVLGIIEKVQDIKMSSAEFMTIKIGKNGRTVQMELTLMQIENHGL